MTMVDEDGDTDGVPDWWVVKYFGHPLGQGADLSRAGDSHAGDGYSNLWKYQNGIDPTVFYIGPIGIWTAMEITWKSVSGTNYQVKWASNLNSNTWYDLGGPVTGNGSTNSVFDSTRNADRKFYRVNLAP
jgi:hypothetical protein